MPAPKGNKYAKGNKGGQPTDYDPKYCQEIINFFSTTPIKKEKFKENIEYFKNGTIKKKSDQEKKC